MYQPAQASKPVLLSYSPSALFLAITTAPMTAARITTEIASNENKSVVSRSFPIASTFPAQAARQMGWSLVPMVCAREIPVPGSLPRAIRVLVHWNTDVMQNEIKHVYLRDAVKLRPDLVAAQ